MRNSEHKVFLLVGTLICLYVVIRAIYVPVLHDEASNFYVNVQHGEFIPFYSDWEAGNHFLNTFLTSSFQWLFGDSLFVFRLASLLFLPLYLFYIWKLSRFFNHAFLRWVFILSLALNTYLIEFFALGRGYGMSMALLLGGLLYVVNYLSNPSRKNLIIFCLLMTLATGANLTMILPFAVISGYLCLHAVLNRNGKRIASLTLWAGVPMFLFGGLGVLMNRLGVLYYGIKTGIWEATVQSLLKAFVQMSSFVPQLIMALLLSFSLIISAYYFIKKRKSGISDHGIFAIYLFFVLIAASFAMRFIFNTNFAEDRTGLYFFPAFVLLLIILVDRLPKLKLIGSVFLIFPVLFFMRANMDHSTYWGYQQIDQYTYDYIKERSEKDQMIPTVGMYSISVVNWFYFNYIDEGKMPFADSDTYPGTKCDYLLIDKSKLKNWKTHYREVRYWEYSKISLLERKVKLKRTKIYSMDVDVILRNNSPHQTHVLKRFEHEDGKDYYAEINFIVNSNGHTARSAVHFDVLYPEDSIYRKHGVPLNWVRRSWDCDTFVAGVILQDLPKGKESINFTLLNSYHDHHTRIKGVVTLWELTY